jgi:single-strand DNA-binding protein
MINKVILIGRITKDPELKYTTSNIAFCQFSLAVNRQFTNADGERETDFINCITWKASAENLAKYVSKGALLGIEGRIEVRSYDDKDGSKKYVTSVVCESVQFLETKKEEVKEKPQAEKNPFKEAPKEVEIKNDDLPF